MVLAVGEDMVLALEKDVVLALEEDVAQEAETLGTDHSISAGRIWSVCSTWWTQLWRRRWPASRPTQPESLLPEEGHSEPGQDKGLEAAKLYPRAEKEGAVGGGLDTGTNYCPGGSHMLYIYAQCISIL